MSTPAGRPNSCLHRDFSGVNVEQVCTVQTVSTRYGSLKAGSLKQLLVRRGSRARGEGEEPVRVLRATGGHVAGTASRGPPPTSREELRQGRSLAEGSRGCMLDTLVVLRGPSKTQAGSGGPGVLGKCTCWPTEVPWNSR